jgi:hypothetical protein
VPPNARSFSVRSNFYSSEFPEWTCSQFNDFFLALLDSSFEPGENQEPNPSDKNLAFYETPAGAVYPVGVNLAHGNTGLFTQCRNGETGCTSGMISTISSCVGEEQLTGTGFDVADPTMGPSGCGASNLDGGATGWLTTRGNVVPGETIELRFIVWDTGDGLFDSLVLLDDFRWSVEASTPGTRED